MGLEIGPMDKIRWATPEKVQEWLRRNGHAEYVAGCGAIYAVLVDDPGIVFSKLAERLGRPGDMAIRGKLISLAYLGLVFLMDGVWWPSDPDYISGPRAEVLGWP